MIPGVSLFGGGDKKEEKKEEEGDKKDDKGGGQGGAGTKDDPERSDNEFTEKAVFFLFSKWIKKL